MDSVKDAREIIAYEKANNNLDFVQVALVRNAWQHWHTGNEELAYNIINEGFNQKLIAGYKYTEMCDNFNRVGEFSKIALQNPLIYLD